MPKYCGQQVYWNGRQQVFIGPDGNCYPVPPQIIAINGGSRRGIPGPPGPDTNIYNIDGTLTAVRTLNMDGKELTFTDGLNRSVEFLARNLFDASGNLVVDWDGQQLLRALDGSLSVDWGQSWLVDNTAPSGIVSVAWIDRILYSLEQPGDVQIASVQWATRELINSDAFTTLNWNLSELYSTVNGTSANWELRQLYDSSSGSFSLDWENLALQGEWTIDSDFEFITNGTGPIIQSPDTTRWRIVVDNAGNVSAVPA